MNDMIKPKRRRALLRQKLVGVSVKDKTLFDGPVGAGAAAPDDAGICWWLIL